MQNYGISLVLALLVGVSVLLAVFLLRPGANQDDPDGDMASLKEEVLLARRGLETLNERMGQLEERLAEIASKPAPPRRDPTPPPATAIEPGSEVFKEAVFTLIEEERRNRNEERRRRSEELRKEIEEMRQGPYDRFNLKVNSIARVLELNDAQRDRYFEITKHNWELLQNARTGIDWRSTEGRAKYQEAQEAIQKEYAAAVEQLLTAEQLEGYGELPAWSKSIQNLGRIPGPDDMGGRGDRTGTFLQGGGQTFRIGGPRAR